MIKPRLVYHRLVPLKSERCAATTGWLLAIRAASPPGLLPKIAMRSQTQSEFRMSDRFDRHILLETLRTASVFSGTSSAGWKVVWGQQPSARAERWLSLARSICRGKVCMAKGAHTPFGLVHAQTLLGGYTWLPEGKSANYTGGCSWMFHDFCFE